MPLADRCSRSSGPALTLLAFVLAAVVGVLLGLLGGGGSILTVPIFVYVLGFDAKSAIAQSLLVVGLTTIVGSLSHWRAGNVAIRLAAIFGGIAVVGAWLGAHLSVLVSGRTQLLVFATTMLISAVLMLRPRPSPADAVHEVAEQVALRTIVAPALGVGLMTGFVGIGGGFMIVPALTVLVGLPMRRAIGTSLVIIGANGIVGFLGYLGRVEVDWATVGGFVLVAGMGTFGGAALGRYIPTAQLRRSFAIFLFGVAMYMLYQNRGAFGFAPPPVGTETLSASTPAFSPAATAAASAASLAVSTVR